MKIALFGAGGTIGRRIAKEAQERGHTVTAIVRKPNRLNHDRFTEMVGDVTNPESVAQLVAEHDVVISAVGPGRDGRQSPDLLLRAARALVAGLREAGVRRLIVVGGAGSLKVAQSGGDLLDAPGFPEDLKPLARAHREALEIYRGSGGDLEWAYASPPAMIEPGERTGRYRSGKDELITDGSGQSRISMEDFAVAVLDEVERPQHSRERFTVGY